MFSLEQQKEHRLQLANILEHNVMDDNYSHLYFCEIKYKETPDTFKVESCGTVHCAGGWAAVYRIGGLINPSSPHLPGTNSAYPFTSIEMVFGTGSYDAIFSEIAKPLDEYGFPTKFNKKRNQVINELRTWEPQP
jgi:hypothetical protein